MKDRLIQFQPYLHLALRLFLGGVFLWSGLSKINHLEDFYTTAQAYKVLPAGFGLIRLQTGRGPLGQSETPCTGCVGEVMSMSLNAVGISKGKDGNGSLEITLEVQDSQGKTLGKPQTSAFTDVSTNEPLQLRFDLPLDKAGKYQVVLKAVDKHNGRTSSLTVPVAVTE